MSGRLESNLSLHAYHRAGAAYEGREANVTSGVSGVYDVLLVEDVLAKDTYFIVHLLGLVAVSGPYTAYKWRRHQTSRLS